MLESLKFLVYQKFGEFPVLLRGHNAMERISNAQKSEIFGLLVIEFEFPKFWRSYNAMEHIS